MHPVFLLVSCLATVHFTRSADEHVGTIIQVRHQCDCLRIETSQGGMYMDCSLGSLRFSVQAADTIFYECATQGAKRADKISVASIVSISAPITNLTKVDQEAGERPVFFGNSTAIAAASDYDLSAIPFRNLQALQRFLVTVEGFCAFAVTDYTLYSSIIARLREDSYIITDHCVFKDTPLLEFSVVFPTYLLDTPRSCLSMQKAHVYLRSTNGSNSSLFLFHKELKDWGGPSLTCTKPHTIPTSNLVAPVTISSAGMNTISVPIPYASVVPYFALLSLNTSSPILSYEEAASIIVSTDSHPGSLLIYLTVVGTTVPSQLLEDYSSCDNIVCALSPASMLKFVTGKGTFTDGTGASIRLYKNDTASHGVLLSADNVSNLNIILTSMSVVLDHFNLSFNFSNNSAIAGIVLQTMKCPDVVSVESQLMFCSVISEQNYLLVAGNALLPLGSLLNYSSLVSIALGNVRSIYASISRIVCSGRGLVSPGLFLAYVRLGVTCMHNKAAGLVPPKECESTTPAHVAVYFILALFILLFTIVVFAWHIGKVLLLKRYIRRQCLKQDVFRLCDRSRGDGKPPSKEPVAPSNAQCEKDCSDLVRQLENLVSYRS